MVLMNPDILSIYQGNIDEISTCVHDSTPIIAINSNVEISVSDSGEPSIEMDDIHSIIEEVKDVNVIVNPEQIENPEIDTLFEKIHELLDVVENPEIDVLFEQIEELLEVVDNPEVDALFEHFKELLDALKFLKIILPSQT